MGCNGRAGRTIAHVVIPTRPVDASVLDALTKASYELAGVAPPRPRLAVVGARAALRELRCAVVPILAAARERGYAIVSGGAIGIDAEVHERALELAIPQLAVLPCGPDRVYPPHHLELVRRIVAAPHSGVLFAQPHGTVPSRAMFVSRNAVVVGLVDAVLVVQADLRSGSATTGTLALRKQLPTAAIIGTNGCADLIARGATSLAWAETEPDRFAERVGAWLDGKRANPEWPDSLARLRDALAKAGPKGATLDELGGPAMATMLWQAAALGLVGETTAGRWVAH
jgi:predicted Rossmann fold nucleotide-binding protein DprA/Smf involved in DNA uptake